MCIVIAIIEHDERRLGLPNATIEVTEEYVSLYVVPSEHTT